MIKKHEIFKNSVIYSFQSRWENSLKSSKIKVFFRKKKPKLQPPRIYFYVGSPTKKIIGFSKVIKIQNVNLDEAKLFSSHGKISEKELISYIGCKGNVYAFWIETPTIFATSIEGPVLNSLFGFNPPQSFCNMRTGMEEFILGDQND